MRKHLLCPLWPMIFPPSVSLPHAHCFLPECSTQTVLCSQILPSLQGSAQSLSLPLRLPDWTTHPSSLLSGLLLWCHSFLKTDGWGHFLRLLLSYSSGVGKLRLVQQECPQCLFLCDLHLQSCYCIFTLLRKLEE